MAQAARLNLRIQKEVKLLLTDLPPGASFPLLSPTSDLSSFSLTSIDAHIEGPESTVYENGVFKIKIQIPERYPFQPPIVTFSTPIYHPNIDTGGRICLDILNLPPKGAWQPSLNISTVLTSIGLLLSEPNPDDGLMCEASKEYKYNKQVFDQKARSMTEKYARHDALCNQVGLQVLTDTTMIVQKSTELVKTNKHEYVVGSKKFLGISRKLSLDASMSQSNTLESDNGVNQERKQDSKEIPFEYVVNPQNITSSSSHKPFDHDQEHKSTAINSKKLCLSSKNIEQTSDSIKTQKEAINTSSLGNPKRKKLGLSGKKPSLGFISRDTNSENDNKGYICLDRSNKGKLCEKGANVDSKKLQRKPLQVLEEKHNHKIDSRVASVLKDDDDGRLENEISEEDGLCDPEGVIVLDSEDSEEEETKGILISRRKRLLGKYYH